MTAMTRDLTSDGDVLDQAKATLALHVRDLDIAVRWYSRVFGTEPVHRGTDTNTAGDSTSYAVFVLAGLTVFLSEGQADDVACVRDHHPPILVFMTRTPLVTLRDALQHRGAHFKTDEVVAGFPADPHGIRAGRDVEFLWFYDPDGNKMEFCRVLATT